MAGWSTGFSEGFGEGTDTANDVRALAGVPQDLDVIVHLETAQDVVAAELVGKGLSDARLGLVAKYLAAHFIILSYEKGGLTQQQVGESMERYNTMSPSNQGYLMTRFGQQAVALDISGTLASRTTGRQNARFRVV